MEFGVEQEVRDGAVILKPSGEVDIYTAPRFKESVLAALEDGAPLLVIDLSKVGFMDSSGLGVLVSALKRATDAGGSLRIVCPEGGVLKIFTITGLQKVFEMHPTLDDALGAVGGADDA